MKKMISAVLAAAVFFSSIQFSSIQAQAATVQEEKKDISECMFENVVGTCEGIMVLPSQRYTGSEIKPDIVIKDGEYTLVEDTDYTVSPYFNSDNVNPNAIPWYSFEHDYGEGCPQVVVYGKGNYKGLEQMIFAILSENQKETEDHLIYSDKEVLAGYDGVTIDGYVGAETEVEIPLYLDGKPVQEINEDAFAYNPTLEKVNVSDNVYRILGGAFFRCRNLKEVNLSRQLWGIDSSAFAGCMSLKEITLPSSLEILGLQVFSGSTSLEAVHSESETIYDVDGVLFDRNGGIDGRTNNLFFFPPAKKVETYRIPDGVQWIGSRSFRKAEHVKNIIIPQSVSYVAQGAASAFGNKAEIVGESENEISTNAINIIFKHDVPNANILDYRLPFSYTLPAGTTITVKNEAMKEAAEASVTEEFLGDVTVQIAPKASQGFELVKNAFTLSKGEEDQLRWTQMPADTTENITWASSDESVVKVDPALGKMTAEGYGECTITGTDESGHKQNVDIFVYDFCSEHSFTANGETAYGWVEGATEVTLVMGMGQEDNLTLRAQANGYAGEQEVKFGSENEDVATVSVSGINPKEAFLDLKKAGTAVITATFDTHNDTITDKIVVHVVRDVSELPEKPGEPTGPENPGNPEGPGNQEIKKQEQQLQYKKSIQKAYGSKPFSLGVKRRKGNGVLSYSSSNKSVATVSKKGVVTIKGTGRATITVSAKETAKYRKKTVKITVDVTPKKQKAGVKSVKGKKLSVKWKKDARATGYQIQYSTDRKFKRGVEKAAIKKKGTASKTISKLKKGKAYYVRVRSYKSIKASGKTKLLYGAWSRAVKSKKIK